MSTGHRSLEHTADFALEVWAPTEPALLVEGARALVEALTDGAEIHPNATRPIELESFDAEDRLVRWLNEVLWLGVSEGFLVVDAELELHELGLEGVARGREGAAALVQTELKSVTYHDLRLARQPDGTYVARVVVDV